MLLAPTGSRNASFARRQASGFGVGADAARGYEGDHGHARRRPITQGERFVIGINWSWLVVFALIVWSLAAGVFPSQNPGPSDGMAQFKGSFPNPGAERRGPTNAQT